MKTRFDQAIGRAKTLSVERQDDLGAIILTLVEQDSSGLHLNDEQITEVERRLTSPGAPIPFDAVFNQFNIQF